MLTITIPETEMWDEEKEEFLSSPGATIKLEHSLVSVSKWESKWHKPFATDYGKTYADQIDYIKCMTITQNVPDSVYLGITDSILEQIQNYINDPMTATTIKSIEKHKSSQIVTSELIYFMMTTYNIPMECQKWHLNRLLTLIQICEIKNSPSKKMSKNEIQSQNRQLNEARKRALNTKG